MNKKRFTISFASLIFDEEMEEVAIDALRNEKYVLGESVYKFEEEFAEYCGTDFAVSTSSGTDALRIALLAMGLPKGSQVIVPAMSFIASANCCLQAGKEPIFADIDPEMYTISPSAIKDVLTDKSSVVLPVHLYGTPAPMDEIMDLAIKKGLRVLEDAAQAHGAIYHQRKVGGIGDAGCFSFYPTKNMTVCGDGGMITTNDSRIARISTILRDCGRTSRHVHEYIGYTSRLNTVNAAIGRVQLRRLDKWIQRRRLLAEAYNSQLKHIEDIRIPSLGRNYVTPACNLYVIQAKDRDKLKLWLESSGIQCGIHYPEAIPFQSVYLASYGFHRGDYPVSEKLAREGLSLPLYPDMRFSQISYICDNILQFYNKLSEPQSVESPFRGP